MTRLYVLALILGGSTSQERIDIVFLFLILLLDHYINPSWICTMPITWSTSRRGMNGKQHLTPLWGISSIHLCFTGWQSLSCISSFGEWCIETYLISLFSCILTIFWLCLKRTCTTHQIGTPETSGKQFICKVWEVWIPRVFSKLFRFSGRKGVARGRPC